MKIQSRKKIYSTITIISAVLGIPGLIIQVYAFFEEQAEKEMERQKSEADNLREQITYAKSVVPNCNFPTLTLMNVSSVLDRAERELVLNENISGSKMLYESVKQEVTICDVSDSGRLPAPSILLPIVPIFVPLAVVFGFLWYTTSKKQSQKRTSK